MYSSIRAKSYFVGFGMRVGSMFSALSASFTTRAVGLAAARAAASPPRALGENLDFACRPLATVFSTQSGTSTLRARPWTGA